MSEKKSRKLLWISTIVILLILVVGGVFLAINSSPTDSKKADGTEKIEEKISSKDEELEENDVPIKGEQSYSVKDGEISPDIENAAGRRAVEYFQTIAGDNFEEYINEIQFVSDKDTDEEASVIVSDGDPYKWVLRINLGFSDERDAKKNLIYSLVHEYAHIFSLNDTQVDGFVEGECPNLFISEGCANPGSYIDDFENAFWADLDADPDSEDFGGYYENAEDDFVTEYAATNAIEDFAETFAHYVLKDTTEFEGVAADKIQFMVDSSDIKSEVQRIRKALEKV